MQDLSAENTPGRESNSEPPAKKAALYLTVLILFPEILLSTILKIIKKCPFFRSIACLANATEITELSNCGI